MLRSYSSRSYNNMFIGSQFFAGTAASATAPQWRSWTICRSPCVTYTLDIVLCSRLGVTAKVGDSSIFHQVLNEWHSCWKGWTYRYVALQVCKSIESENGDLANWHVFTLSSCWSVILVCRNQRSWGTDSDRLQKKSYPSREERIWPKTRCNVEHLNSHRLAHWLLMIIFRCSLDRPKWQD